MTAIPAPNGKQFYELPNGLPNVGGKVYTYAAGTSTPQTTWVDAGQVTPQTNPVILDARGEASVFWNGNYKVTLKDALDNTIWTQDNLQFFPPDTTLRSELAASSGADMIGTDSGDTVQEALDTIFPRLTPNPSFDRATYNAYNVFNNSNTDYAALFRAQQGPGFNGTDVVTIAFTVPSTAPIHMAMGLHVEGVSNRAAVAGLGGDIGIYSAMTVTHDDGNIHALNLVCNDTAGKVRQTIQNEFDFNVFAPDTSVVGLDLILNTALSGTFGNAFMVRAFNVGRWGSVVFSPAGSAENVVYGGARLTGNSQASQKIQLSSTSSAGATLDGIVQLDATGIFNIYPAQDPTTKATVLGIRNLSSASNTTKTVTAQFYGTDTLAVEKATASFVVSPADVNYSGSSIVVNVRASDAVVPSATFVPYGIKLTPRTLAQLGAASSWTGMLAYVTDATAPTWGSTITGGGAVHTLAFSNGTNWTAR